MDKADIRIIVKINGRVAYNVLTFNTKDAKEAATKIMDKVTRDIETARLISPIYGAIL